MSDRKEEALTMSGYVVFTREKTLDQGELEVYAGKPDNCHGHEVKMLRFMVHTKTWKGRPRKAL